MREITQSPLRRQRIPLEISSWLTFGIALAFYWITADPGASYWDCPEYVTIASKMEVGHSPGNPIWMLAMRMATLPFSPENHAYVINLCSGVLMAFAAFFLSRIIFLGVSAALTRGEKGNNWRDRKSIVWCASGFIAIGSSLCFALCDSVWYSAVEAEVYAMSTFLAGASLWIIALYWMEQSPSKEKRLLILLAYLTGMSLGVHQLNLLLIPGFALVVLFKKYPEKINPVLSWLTAFGGCLILVVILMGIMPGLLFGAQSFELWGVNELGLPYDTGVIIFVVILIALFLIALTLTWGKGIRGERIKRTTGVMNVSLWMAAFIILGYSSFGMIMVRAQASPPMNEGAPSNIFSLADYITREQYPSAPLLYGATPYSKPIVKEEFNEEGRPLYSHYLLKRGKGMYLPFEEGGRMAYRSNLVGKGDSLFNQRVFDRGRGYLLKDYAFSLVMTPELDMWFPRMTSQNIGHRRAYEGWSGMTEETMDRIEISETIDSAGSFGPKLNSHMKREWTQSYRPTYSQQFQYFLSYQAYYMYFRYLFWNFIGRQNDYHSTGEIDHGNFITGIPVIDEALIGELAAYPPELLRDNRGYNRYFGIPFIIGIIGIVWLGCRGRRSRRILMLTAVLFVMTGIAIVAYLNQNPGEVRERDYTFLENYMVFAMWIVAGMTAIAKFILWIFTAKGNKRGPYLAMVFIAFFSLGPAALMATENFDDHDRRNRYEPTFYASAYLDFEKPAIIFSEGDNLTFPLWYATEVLGMGKDHTVVDVTYLSMPYYMANLKRNASIPTFLTTPEYIYDKFVYTRIPSDQRSAPMKAEEALRGLYESEKQIPEWPTSKLIFKGKDGEDRVVNLHEFTKGSIFLPFSSLMLIDILANAEREPESRALFFPSNIENAFYHPLDSLLHPVLFGKVYLPSGDRKEAIKLLRASAQREISKLDSLQPHPHYMEEIHKIQSTRYRGDMILGAQRLLDYGDTLTAGRIVDAIERHYSYETLLPGNYTLCDTTFYEGKAYRKLLGDLYESTGNQRYKGLQNDMDSLLKTQHERWVKFYYLMTPEQRKNLSNQTRLNLSKPI